MVEKLKILFVCRGNKFRSKIAEAYFKKINKNRKIKVKSCGINPVKPAPKKLVNRVRRDFKIKSINIKPRKITKKLIKWADIIIITADNVNIKFPNKRVVIWKIPDAEEENIKEIKRIIKIIIRKVEQLNKMLSKEAKRR